MHLECKLGRSEPAAPGQVLEGPVGSLEHKPVYLEWGWEAGEPQGGSWWRTHLWGEEYCICSTSRWQLIGLMNMLSLSSTWRNDKHLWKFSAAPWPWPEKTEREAEPPLLLKNPERTYMPPLTCEPTQTAEVHAGRQILQDSRCMTTSLSETHLLMSHL